MGRMDGEQETTGFKILRATAVRPSQHRTNLSDLCAALERMPLGERGRHSLIYDFSPVSIGGGGHRRESYGSGAAK